MSVLRTHLRPSQFLIQSTYARFLWLICTATRQALRYLIRNTTLPQSVRDKAKLQLARMHSYTRATAIRNRCIMGGVARSVFRDFRMGRVSRLDVSWQKDCTFLYRWWDESSSRLTCYSTVPIPNECACRKLTRGEKGELVTCCVSCWRQR